MDTLVNTNDPRVKRTRELLVQAFIALLHEKRNIRSISVLDIAERATVNRATFYAHFEDKYAILETWMRGKFQKALRERLAEEAPLQVNTLHTLIVGVFEFLALFRRYQKPIDKEFEPLSEIAIQKELYEILFNWLSQIASPAPLSQEVKETTTLVISWAIFGSAVQWSREGQPRPAEEMANQVLIIVIAGLSPVVVIS